MATQTSVADDGTRIPISLVYRKSLRREGPQPLLLYGYGSYGFPMDPYFSSSRLSLLDRGMVYAIAHVRGGGDRGRTWYNAGKLLRKKNTFTDFIAVAESLVRRRWTAPDRLVIQGGSAGGLLMGAVANMRPDLFRAIVADVPFVDVINTMSDASLPLTAQEWEQWGNPAVAEQGRSELPRILRVLDAEVGERPFLAGDRPSIADCTLFGTWEFARMFGVEFDPACANLHRWHAAFGQRPSASWNPDPSAA